MKSFLVLLVCISNLLYASKTINTVKVLGNVKSIDVNSKAWLSAGYQDIFVYSKDKKIKSEKIKIKSIYDGANISFLIKWNDSTINDINTTTYINGFSIQFPTSYKDSTNLPYIDMGDSKRSVISYIYNKKTEYIPYRDRSYINFYEQDIYTDGLKNLDNNSGQIKIDEFKNVWLSNGANNKENLNSELKDIKINLTYKNGEYKGVLSKKLTTSYLDLNEGAFPISFIIKEGRNSTKLYSTWIGVKLSGINNGQELISILKATQIGNIDNGKKISYKNCAVCHRYKNTVIAPEYLAPNLSNIGGYSTKEYLKESLLSPNTVIVEQENKNNLVNFQWSQISENGEKKSMMPKYDWMSEREQNDLVAFLKTLI